MLWKPFFQISPVTRETSKHLVDKFRIYFFVSLNVWRIEKRTEKNKRYGLIFVCSHWSDNLNAITQLNNPKGQPQGFAETPAV